MPIYDNTEVFRMKKLLITLLMLLPIQSFAKELQSFREIYDSISNGKNIKLVIDFDACDPKPPVTHIQVFTKPAAVMLRQSYLQFANSPITRNDPAYPKKPVMRNVTYKLTNDGKLNIMTTLMTLPDYTVVKETSSVCPLNLAVKVYN